MSSRQTAISPRSHQILAEKHVVAILLTRDQESSPLSWFSIREKQFFSNDLATESFRNRSRSSDTDDFRGMSVIGLGIWVCFMMTRCYIPRLGLPITTPFAVTLKSISLHPPQNHTRPLYVTGDVVYVSPDHPNAVQSSSPPPLIFRYYPMLMISKRDGTWSHYPIISMPTRGAWLAYFIYHIIPRQSS